MGKRGCKKLNWCEVCKRPFGFNRYGTIRSMKLCRSLGKKRRHQGMEGAGGTRWGADEGERTWFEKFAVKVSKGGRSSGKSTKLAQSKGDIKNV